MAMVPGLGRSVDQRLQAAAACLLAPRGPAGPDTPLPELSQDRRGPMEERTAVRKKAKVLKTQVRSGLLPMMRGRCPSPSAISYIAAPVGEGSCACALRRLRQY